MKINYKLGDEVIVVSDRFKHQKGQIGIICDLESPPWIEVKLTKVNEGANNAHYLGEFRQTYELSDIMLFALFETPLVKALHEEEAF